MIKKPSQAGKWDKNGKVGQWENNAWKDNSNKNGSWGNPWKTQNWNEGGRDSWKNNSRRDQNSWTKPSWSSQSSQKWKNKARGYKVMVSNLPPFLKDEQVRDAFCSQMDVEVHSCTVHNGTAYIVFSSKAKCISRLVFSIPPSLPSKVLSCLLSERGLQEGKVEV